MNAWNLKKSNSRLQIIEKTQAHRKHLINLISAKSCLDSRNPLKPRSNLTGSIQLLHKHQVLKNNESMVKRIVKISKTQSEARNHSNSLCLSRNLKTYSSLNRTIRLQEIDKQNQKLYSRLLMTSPTIRRQQWVKRSIQTAKYKQNLHRGKYIQPDFSEQACRILGRLPKFRSVKILTKNGSPQFKFTKISKKI